MTSIELAELEVSFAGADRFVSCPPPGEIGQPWIPPIPAWNPAVSFAIAPGSTPRGPASSEIPGGEAAPLATAQPKDGAEGGSAPDGAPAPSVGGPSSSATRTGRAISETLAGFRRCYHAGLLYDPTQDGHVAIVLRVGRDGRVVQTEHYGACDLSSEVIQCMKETAAALRFEPPASGSDTLVIPAVFHRRDPGRAPSPNDAYTANAYVAIEQARPALHRCEERNRRGGKGIFASAMVTLDVDREGRVSHAHFDPWEGDQELLACAVEALDAVRFPAPPAGLGRFSWRLSFNPRPHTK